MQNKLNKFLQGKQYPQDLPLDGQLHRFDVHASTNNGWFVGKVYGVGDKKIIHAWFGDWREGTTHHYESDCDLTPAELKELQTKVDIDQATVDDAKKKRWEEVASASCRIWDNLPTLGESGYLVNKKIDKLYGCRLIRCREEWALVVPATDVRGKIWGYQTISSSGFKSFLPGMRIEGCFTSLDARPLSNEDTIFICEGFSTGASIYMAVKKPVLSAFNAGNLLQVAQAVREAHPGARLIIVADDDAFTTIQGKQVNVGKIKAKKAAKLVKGEVFVPKFANLDQKPTDCNDLHCLEGLQELRSQILRFLDRGQSLEALDMPLNKQGKPARPTEKHIAETILEYYGDSLIMDQGHFFKYVGTHWHMFTPGDEDNLKKEILTVAGGTLGIRQVEATLAMLQMLAPKSSASLFSPTTDAANFLNGTLRMTRKPDGSFDLNFGEHDESDLLTNVIPQEYHPGGEPTQFLNWLDTAFDSDKEEKIAAVQEMLGACLCPAFPRFFLFHGPAGTGKSTILLYAYHLLDPSNVSMVDPSDFQGFNMEAMVGKLVNISTDLPMRKVLSDSVVKKIEDRIPITINRKFRTDLRAPLPAVHLFASNNLPSTLEGDSRAHQRRWTFISLNHCFTTGDQQRDYGARLFEAESQQAVAWAVEGLRRLCQNKGFYTSPKSSREAVSAWLNDQDAVACFVADIECGEGDKEGNLYLDAEGEIPRQVLWDYFVDWFQLTHIHQRCRLGRNNFYSLLEGKGFAPKRSSRERLVTGIALRTGENAVS